MDFEFSARSAHLQQEFLAYLDSHVYPAEDALSARERWRAAGRRHATRAVRCAGRPGGRDAGRARPPARCGESVRLPSGRGILPARDR